MLPLSSLPFLAITPILPLPLLSSPPTLDHRPARLPHRQACYQLLQLLRLVTSSIPYHGTACKGGACSGTQPTTTLTQAQLNQQRGVMEGLFTNNKAFTEMNENFEEIEGECSHRGCAIEATRQRRYFPSALTHTHIAPYRFPSDALLDEHHQKWMSGGTLLRHARAEHSLERYADLYIEEKNLDLEAADLLSKPPR